MKAKFVVTFLLMFGKLYSQTDLPNDGITSTSHKKYIGKIVFASSITPLKFGSENENEFLNRFMLGQSIFFRVYLDNSLFNYINNLSPGYAREEINSKGGYLIKLYLDNEEVYSGNACDGTSEFSPSEQEEMTTFKGALRNPDERGIGENAYDRFLYKSIGKLTEGDHTVRVELYPTVSIPSMKIGSLVATGEFTLNVTRDYAYFFKVSYRNFYKMKTSTDYNGNKIIVDENGKTVATYYKGSSENQFTVKDVNNNIIHNESVDFNGNIEVRTVNGSWLGTFKKDFNGKVFFDDGN